MRKPWLAMVLMLLVALQAVTAAADAHQFHQLEHRHLELSEAHRDEASPATADQVETAIDRAGRVEAPSNQPATDECQHCCHCHGSFHAVFSAPALSIHIIKSQRLPTYHADFPTRHPSTLYRPPKA